MPKILINEKDYTTPGMPGNYSNYAVLITGFCGRDSLPDDEIQPDSNGVYEFSKVEDFVATIGLTPPKQVLAGEGTTDETSVNHYGNQMAYELLNLGYSIVYKPITAENLINDDVNLTIFSPDFWEIFKDKVSYDFRFITHGFLDSTDLSNKASYNTNKQRLDELEAAIEKLKGIKVEADSLYEAPEEADENANHCNELYTECRNDYPGFKSKNGDLYSSYDDAVVNTEIEYNECKTSKEIAERYAITSGNINEVNACIANLAKYFVLDDTSAKETPGRGDCIALIELDETKYINNDAGKPEDKIINAINEMSGIDEANGKYCAMTVPSVYYKMAIDETKPNNFNNNVKFPGAFHYLACFISSLKAGFAEWYAAAGYSRGTSSYIIDHASVKFGEIAINALEPRNTNDDGKLYPKFACNVIACFRGSYYLWGNRTAHPLGKKGDLVKGDLVASSFLNIRQLSTTIKKQLYVACRTFTFDPNSDTLWVNFVNLIKPTLEVMKADHGIRDYKIIREAIDKKATLKAKIRIIPIEAVEDFDLEVSLEDSFGETTAVISD